MLNDFRYAVRSLVKNPGFAIAAIVTLALGIGLNVSVFSILNALLFKPLPVHDADELVWITRRPLGPDRGAVNLTYPDVVELRQATPAVDDIAAFSDARLGLRAGTHSSRVTGHIVTGNYFSVLGVRAAAGRVFTDDDGRTVQHHAVVVISDSLSQRLFGGLPGPVGQTIEVNGQTYTVVGVAPQHFKGVDILAPADVWVPIWMAAAVTSIRDPYDRDVWWLRGIGRLADDVGIRQGHAALQGVAAAIAQAHPATHKDFSVAVHRLRGVAPQDQEQIGALALLPAVPLTVLLIACANVAGLLIARSAGRRREIAIRTALGASRRHLIRQLLAESLVLAFASGACSLLIALWAPELLVRLVDAPVEASFTPDGRVVLFTFSMCVLTALAVGLGPALRASRTPAASSLRGEPGAPETGPRSGRLQRLLVAGQLALSVVLLMAAGLFLESVAQARQTHVGFETGGRVTLSLDLKMQRYTDARAATFHRSVLERLSASPGIRRATLAAFVPLGGRVMIMPFYPAGQPIDPDARTERAAVNLVGPGFFETIGLPVRRGRGITSADQTQVPRVAVINEALAARLAPAGDPVGQRIIVGDPGAPPVEVVGVAADAIVDEFGEAPHPTIYLPHDRSAGEISIIAWTTLEPAAALNALVTAVRSLDPSLAVFAPMSMAQHVGERMDAERGLSKMLGVAGALALGLAAFGLYGVTAYTVTRRTREIGVRVALGANRTDILHLVLGDAARLAAYGLIAGLIPGIAVTFLLSGVLFGVRPADPVAIAVATLLLTSAAFAASYLPARRALRVDPLQALRTE